MVELKFLLSFLLASALHAAIGVGNTPSACVQSATNTASCAGTVSFTAGRTVIVVIAIKGSTTTVSTVTDNASGGSSTYTKLTGCGAVNSAGNNVSVECWTTSAQSVKTATQLTVTISANGKFVWMAQEFTGVASFGTPATATVGGATAPTVTMSEGNNYCVGGFAGGGGGTFTSFSGGGTLASTGTTTGSLGAAVGGALAYKTVATHGSDCITQLTEGSDSSYAKIAVEIRQGPYSYTMSDTTLSAETVARTLGLLRAPGSVSTLSTVTVAATRASSSNKNLSVTAVSGVAVARSIIAFSRSASDAALSAESVTRVATFLRAASSTTLSAEVVAVIRNVPRTATDTAVSAESATRSAIQFPRTATDTAVSAEATARVLGLLRAASDGALSAESLARGLTSMSRTPSDVTLSAESLASIKGAVRTASATTLSAESLGRQSSAVRALADGALSGEAPARAFSAARAASDATLSGEVVGRGFVFQRAMSDGTFSAVVLTAQMGALRTATNAALSAEVLSRAFAGGRVASVQAFFSESTATAGGKARTASDSTLSGESAATLAAIRRTVSDGSFSEAATRVAAAARIAADGAISEGVGRISAAIREASDGAMTETLGRFLASLRTAANGALAESAGRVSSASRGMTDGSLAEVAGSGAGYVRAAAGNATAGVTVVGTYHSGGSAVSRSLTANAAVSPVLSAVAARMRGASDGLLQAVSITASAATSRVPIVDYAFSLATRATEFGSLVQGITSFALDGRRLEFSIPAVVADWVMAARRTDFAK